MGYHSWAKGREKAAQEKWFQALNRENIPVSVMVGATKPSQKDQRPRAYFSQNSVSDILKLL